MGPLFLLVASVAQIPPGPPPPSPGPPSPPSPPSCSNIADCATCAGTTTCGYDPTAGAAYCDTCSYYYYDQTDCDSLIGCEYDTSTSTCSHVSGQGSSCPTTSATTTATTPLACTSTSCTECSSKPGCGYEKTSGYANGYCAVCEYQTESYCNNFAGCTYSNGVCEHEANESGECPTTTQTTSQTTTSTQTTSVTTTTVTTSATTTTIATTLTTVATTPTTVATTPTTVATTPTTVATTPTTVATTPTTVATTPTTVATTPTTVATTPTTVATTPTTVATTPTTVATTPTTVATTPTTVATTPTTVATTPTTVATTPTTVATTPTTVATTPTTVATTPTTVATTPTTVATTPTTVATTPTTVATTPTTVATTPTTVATTPTTVATTPTTVATTPTTVATTPTTVATTPTTVATTPTTVATTPTTVATTPTTVATTPTTVATTPTTVATTPTTVATTPTASPTTSETTTPDSCQGVNSCATCRSDTACGWNGDGCAKCTAFTSNGAGCVAAGCDFVSSTGYCSGSSSVGDDVDDDGIVYSTGPDPCTETPFAINNYYPLYSTAVAAIIASSTNSHHTHVLNGVTYYMPNGLAPGEQFHGNYSTTTPVPSVTTGGTATTTTTAESAGVIANALTSHLADFASGSNSYQSFQVENQHVQQVEVSVEEKADDAHTVTLEFGTIQDQCIMEALVGIAKAYYSTKYPDQTIIVSCANIDCTEIDVCPSLSGARRRSTHSAATIDLGPAVASTTAPAPRTPSAVFPGFSDSIVATPTAIAGLAVLAECIMGAGDGRGSYSPVSTIQAAGFL